MFAEINPAYMIAALFFLTCGGFLYLCGGTIISTTKTRSRQDYVATVLCLAVFSLFYGLMTIAEYETLKRVFWAGGFIAFFMFFPIWFLFLSNMVTFRIIHARWAIWGMGLITLLVSLQFVLSDNTVFVATRHGNQFSYQGSLALWVALAYLLLLIVVLLSLHLRWLREDQMKRNRRLALAFVVTVILILPIALATDIVIPSFLRYTSIPLMPMCILIASVMFFVSMRNNQTLSITVPNVSGYIFRSATTPTLVLDHLNVIRLENDAAACFMGRSIVGENIGDIVLVGEKAPERSFFDSNFTSEVVTANTPSGIRICEMLLSVERDKYDDALCKIVSMKDITENVHRDNLLQAVGRATKFLLNSDIETFEDDLQQGLGVLGEALGVDHAYICRNHTEGGKLCATKVREWSDDARLQQGMRRIDSLPYEEALPGLEELLLNGQCFCGAVSKLSAEDQAHFASQGIKSVMNVPVFIYERLWGYIGFDDFRSERRFSDTEISILQSCGMLFAHAYIRNEIVQGIRETSVQMELALQQANAANKAKRRLTCCKSPRKNTMWC